MFGKKKGYRIKTVVRDCNTGGFKILESDYPEGDKIIYLDYSKGCKVLKKKLKRLKKEFKNTREIVFEEVGSGYFRMVNIRTQLETEYFLEECGLKLK